MAVQIIAALSAARIVAIDSAPEKLEISQKLGADHSLLAAEASAEAIRALTGGRGAELVLDVVGSAETLALAGQLLAFEGDLTLLGLAGGTLEYSAMSLPWGARIATTYWGTAVELMEVLDLARSGSIEVRTERVGLDGVADAYERLRNGQVEGRVVACPGD